MERVNSVIIRYLKNNKRLVIPTLGAFIRKDDGQVVFMEFLKKDDGVLAAQVAAAYPLTPQQYTAMVDRYVAALRQGATSPQGFTIPRLGVVRTDAGGLMYLDYDPDTQPAPAPAPAAAAGNVRPAATPVNAPVPTPVTAPGPAPALKAASASGPKTGPAVPTAAGAAADPTVTHPLASRIGGGVQGQAGDATASAPAAQPRAAAPVASQPGPGAQSAAPAKGDVPVDGMRYGKPAPQTPDRRKRRADLIMIIAIAAAAIAIAVMIFSVLSEQPQQFDLDGQTEIPAVVQPDTLN